MNFIHTIIILCFAIIFSTSILTNQVYAVDVSPEEFSIIQQFESLKKTDKNAAELFLHDSLKTMRTASLLYQAGLIEIDKNQISKAAEYFSEVLKLDNTFPNARMNRGRLNLRLDNHLAGIEDLLAGIKVDGADNDTMKLLNDAYSKINQPIAGEQLLRWAILTNPKDPELHILLAYSLFQQNRFSEAAKIANMAMILGSTDIAAWTIRIHAAIEADKINDAIDILEETRLYHDELSDDYLWLLGELYLNEGLIREASTIFSESHQKKPLHNKKLITFLETLISLEKIEELDRLSSSLREQDPTNARAIYYCAYACQLKGDIIGATNFAKKATEMDAGYGEAYILLGKLYSKADKVQDALNSFRIARSFSNVKLQALRLELELWMQAENWVEALEILELLSQIEPNSNWSSLISSITNYVQE